MHTESGANKEWQALQTSPTVPDPAVCRGKIIAEPHAVQCLVEWPIYCLYAARVGKLHYCGHKDRMQFAARAEAEKQRELEKRRKSYKKETA